MPDYCGRFAPSPTGPLHLGSLFAAVLSYAHARHHQGRWLLRIEDIDPPREEPGAADAILRCLEAHGLEWDALSYQHAHSARYEQLLSDLIGQQKVYACPCSRKQLAQQNGKHGENCPLSLKDAHDCAYRLHCQNNSHSWYDGFRGWQAHEVEQDFVLKRRDGLWAYQLAVVADDHAQGITHVVRGSDLLASTPAQLALYESLAWQPPQFFHFPVITNERQKLSKQNHAPAIDNSNAAANLQKVLELLQISTTDVDDASRVGDILSYTVDHLHQSKILKLNTVALTDTKA